MLERTALLTDFCHSHTLRRWTVRRSCGRLFSPSALSYTPYDAAVSYEMAVRLLCHGAMIYNKPLRDYYAMAVPLQRHPIAMSLQPRHELSRMALPSLWNGMMRDALSLADVSLGWWGARFSHLTPSRLPPIHSRRLLSSVNRLITAADVVRHGESSAVAIPARV